MEKLALGIIVLIGGLTAACGGGGGGAQCGELTACGGDVVATWSIVDQCLTGFPDSQNCGVTLVSDNINVTGSVTFNADGTFTQNLATTGTLVTNIPAGCFQGAVTNCAMLNNATTECTGNASVACECTISQNETSTEPGLYTTAGNSITIDGVASDYCVDGDTLSVKQTNPGFSVELILEK